MSSPHPLRLIPEAQRHAFTIKGKTLEALVTSVYDGDTITVCAAPFPKYSPELVFTLKIRVMGYDAAEKKHPKDAPTAVRELGKRATARATELCLDQIVTLKGTGREPWGRELAYVTLPDGRDLGEVMMKEHLGYPYEGRHKKDYAQQLELAECYFRSREDEAWLETCLKEKEELKQQ